MTDWSPLRTFLAVVHTGSQSEAARRLGTTRPRVRRRIVALERGLGQRLFLRSPLGERAHALVPMAEAMESAAAPKRRAPAGASGDDVSAKVRVSDAAAMAAHVLPPRLAHLRERHPRLRFGMQVSNAPSDLLAREVDVAVRMAPPRQLDLVQSHVGEVSVGPFAHRLWTDRCGVPDAPAEAARAGALLGPDRDPVLSRMWREVVPELPPNAFALRTDDGGVLWSALRAGLGVGAWHVPVGAATPDLGRVAPAWSAPLGVWIVTRPDLRAEPHIVAVVEQPIRDLKAYSRT